MQYKTIEDHKDSNKTPFVIMKGTRVKVGRTSDDADGWRDWIYCYTLDGISEGWAPVQIIHVENEYGIVIEDYSAKELEVKKGEIVEGETELNGWIWCNKLNGLEYGWLPKEKVFPFSI